MAPPERLVAASVLLAAYALFCLFVWWRHRAARRPALAIDAGGDDGDAILVAYASQTGFAERLAHHTADALRAAARPVRLASLGTLDVGALGGVRQALFIVSTSGEGDAPDSAVSFLRSAGRSEGRLAGLRYGLMALGDSSFRNFCGFGRGLDGWLRHHGATPLFDPVEVDRGDGGAIRHWQASLARLGAAGDAPDWRAPDYQPWRLVGRRLINPGSVGGPIFHLRLAPSGAMPWTAGDIAEIGPRNDPDAVAALLHQLGVTDDADAASLLARHHLPEAAALEGRPPSAWAELLLPLPHREYSIASLPADGAVELVVRQVRRDDGGLGLGSGWLTRHAPLGCDIALRVRENRSFHPPAEPTPLILIGNGTGIAGLRVHLKHAEAVGSNGHWLLFGERNAAHDRLFADEIAQWRDSGLLDRVDLAFSRDQPARVHVQHLLADAGDELRRRLDGGAAIYVCGSLEGMAGAVTRTLVDLIGTDRLHHLIDTQRYRRDVY